MSDACLVSLVGGQPNPTLILAAKLAPILGRVLILTTEDILRQGTPAHLRQALELIKPGLRVETTVLSSGFEFAPLEAETAAALPDGQVVVDVTGGTKPMSIALAAAARRRGLAVCYVDTQHQRILADAEVPGLKDGSLPELSAEVIFTACGFAVDGFDASPLTHRQRELIQAVVRDLAAWDEYRTSVEANGALGGKMKSPCSPRALSLLQTFQRLGYIADLQSAFPHRFKYASEEARKYLQHGDWLEDHIYAVAQQCGFHQVLRRVHVHVASGGELVRNEFDVVIADRCTLAFISCKAGKVENLDKEHLAEVFTLAQVAGGVFSRKIFATTRAVPPAWAERAKALRIDLLEARDPLAIRDRLAKLVRGGAAR